MKNRFSYKMAAITTALLFTTIFLRAEQKVQLPVDTVHASDFGVKSNSFENASPGIRKAIEHCKKKRGAILLLPGGRIDLWPKGAFKKELYISNATENDSLSKVKNIGFLLENLKNIAIEGNNTLIVLHGKMVSFAILHSENVLIKNMLVDYERPTMSEFTIQSVSPKSVEAMIHPDSKYYIDKNGRIQLYGEGWMSKAFHTIVLDPAKNIMNYSSFKPFLESKAISTGPLQLKFEGNFSKINFQKGDVLSVRDPYRDNVGGFISRSKNIKLENIGMQYMHGLGIISQFSENISLLKIKVAPAEGSGRTISSFADCFHFSGCKGRILIDSCFTSGSHDDPVNVHGTHLKIIAIHPGNILTVRFMHHQTYGFKAFFAGDSIAFINPATLLPIGEAVLNQAKLINKREMELVLKGKMPNGIKVGDCIENITWTPELTVRNSRFERTNTRGVLVTTRRKVLIENNTFFRTGMYAILIADDAAGWYESGPVQDVIIRNNRFEECGYNSVPGNFVIAIAPENHAVVKGLTVHKNIRIENNVFKIYDYPVLTAKSVTNLVFNNNKIISTDFMPASEKVKAQFRLDGCINAEIKNNRYSTSLMPTVDLLAMDRRELQTDVGIINALPENNKKNR